MKNVQTMEYCVGNERTQRITTKKYLIKISANVLMACAKGPIVSVFFVCLIWLLCIANIGERYYKNEQNG